jgi:S1-C subfamily serine protease
MSQSKDRAVKYLKKTATALVVIAITTVLSVGIIKIPEIHRSYLRHKVGSKTFMIKGKKDGGGGTGFQILAPSGQTYVMTNSHVCEGALTQSEDKDSLIVEDNDGNSIRRRVLENSDFTDLCLLEGMPGVEGLKLAKTPVMLGDTEYIVGHPLLRPLSVSDGEIVGLKDVKIPTAQINTPEEEQKCSLPKNEVVSLEMDFYGIVKMPLKLCLNVTKAALMTTVIIFPGNSGSPMVNAYGEVTGVAFAADATSWGYAVSLRDVRRMLLLY